MTDEMRIFPKARGWLTNWKSLIVLIFITLLSLSCIDTHSRWLRQEQAVMAHELGVDIDDYGPAIRFPWGYLQSRVSPGMSIQEVHQVVPRHEAVYSCPNATGSAFSEVYYFFSDEDEKAVRIEVIYDMNGKLRFTDPEDPNSSRLSIVGCEPGYLPE